MKRIVTAGQMRAIDAAAPGVGVTSEQLMERAGVALAQEARSLCEPRGRVVVFAGPGNNGGDGLVAARWLHVQGRRVVLWHAPAGTPSAEVQLNHQRALACGVPRVTRAADLQANAGDVVIDALFGTGLSRELSVEMQQIVSHINALRAQGARVVSADVPSGLDADTGAVRGAVVNADVTVCFAMLKPALAQYPGLSWAGDVRVVDIGMPAKAIAVVSGPPLALVDEDDVRAMLPRRAAASNKGSHGHVLVVAGSEGKSGAASLCAQGALHGGAGLVTVRSERSVCQQVVTQTPEIMALPEGDWVELANARQAVVIGPGIAPVESQTLETSLRALTVPAVLDADALNSAAARPSILKNLPVPVVITPHPKEFARLTGRTVAEVQAARVSLAAEFATTLKLTVVLKGARSVIALPDGRVFINPTGNSGMATGGTGDVLAGVIGALLAQGLTAEQAALVGTFAHGLAADLRVGETGLMGFHASELLRGLQRVWVRWQR